jgi:phage portal protein BeeE
MSASQPSFTDRVKIVGKSLMGLVAPRSVYAPTGYTDDGASGIGGFWFFGADGSEKHFGYTGTTSAVEAYRRCAPFAAVINRKIQAAGNARTWVLDTVDTKTTKAGKESTTKIANTLRTLLNRPNPLQNWDQFRAQANAFVQLFGWCPILIRKPDGFPNYQAQSLYILPPPACQIAENNNTLFSGEGTLAAIEFTYNTQRTTLPAKNIFILKDYVPSFVSTTLPGSRVEALGDAINNCIGAMESRNVLINYRGSMGIFSSEKKDAAGNAPLTPKEKREVQEELRGYGLRSQQMQFIVTSASLKWQQTSIPTKDLMLFEEVKESLQQICDAYGHPYRLMSANDVNSLGGSDLKEYKKAFYQDTILPEVESLFAQLGEMFELSKYGLKLDADFSHLPLLQEDRGTAATARKTLNEALLIEWNANMLTIDEWRVALGEDPLPDGLGQVRIGDRTTNTILAVTLGVGGVQSLISLITAPGMSPEARQAAVEIIFGLSPEQAARLAAQASTPPTTGGAVPISEPTKIPEDATA